MLRRDSKLAFAGGMWVFPGGRVDPEDFPAGADRDDPDALFAAARTAAVREAKEEADLDVDAEGLVWFADWTPPAGEVRRFATWFFVAGAPKAPSSSTTARSGTTSGCGRPTRSRAETWARSS